MSNTDIKLTAKKILEKDFKVSMRGYNQEEVDLFLDTIIEDYKLYNQELEQLKQENENLKREIARTKTTSTSQPPVRQVNYDVLKRLSNLEKEVFGRKVNEP